MPRVTITVPEKNAQPYRFQLEREVVTIGRGSECDIVIDSTSVSTNHAEMRRTANGYELVDVGSTNGITLDEVLQTVVRLKNGAAVKIGDVGFDFQLSEEESATIAREDKSRVATVTPGPGSFPAGVKPVAPATIYVPEASGGSGLAMLVFLILAVAAFFAGLAVRYQKETGGNLIQAIKSHAAPQPQPTK
jgi:pSer/pThr/pTyr-binding forkhead associated (FHA) protein